MPNKIVMFPGANNTEALKQISANITTEMISSIVQILNSNKVDIENPELELQLAGACRILKAIVDDQIGLDNPLKKEVERLKQFVIEQGGYMAKRNKLERKLDEYNHTMELVRTIVPIAVLVLQVIILMKLV